MTIGKKIKMIRTLKGLTQKELGYMVGLTDVRIRQYEIDARTPKEDLINQFAKALDVSPLFFTDHSIDTPEDIMHALFELEHTAGAQIIQISEAPAKYAITFDIPSLNAHLGTWYDRKHIGKTESTNDDIAYNLWKAQFSNDCLDH